MATSQERGAMSVYPLVARHILAPMLDQLRGTSTMRRLSHLERSQWWPRERIEERQCYDLRRLVDHAYAHVPYYRRKMDSCGVRPEDFRSLEDLRKLPILTKTAIRSNAAEMLSDAVPLESLRAGASGGTTGERLQFYSTREERFTYSYARWTLTLMWAGALLGQPHISIRQRSTTDTSHQLKRLSLALQRLTRVDTMTVSEENLHSLVRTFREIRPRSLFSYPSALALIAAYARSNHTLLPAIPAVCVGGERLLARQKGLFEEAFGSVPFVRYGSNELHEVAGQCETRGGLHILAEDFVVEVVNETGAPLPPGTTGQLVITSLHNRGMPFIRYAPGDIGSMQVESCPCGRGLPLLDVRIGRTRDYVRARNGTSIAAMDIDIERSLPPGILQYQLVQEDLNHCALRFVPAESVSDDVLSDLSRSVNALLASKLGTPMQVALQPVDRIEMNLSGKRLSFLSKLVQIGDADSPGGVESSITGGGT
jgi:phenylacetate-CoA ligase